MVGDGGAPVSAVAAWAASQPAGHLYSIREVMIAVGIELGMDRALAVAAELRALGWQSVTMDGAVLWRRGEGQ